MTILRIFSISEGMRFTPIAGRKRFPKREGRYPPIFGPQTLHLVFSLIFLVLSKTLFDTQTPISGVKIQNLGYFLFEKVPNDGLDPSYSYLLDSHPIFVLSIKFNTSRCFNQHMNLGPGLIQTIPFTQFHCEYIEWGQIAFSNDIFIDRNSCVTLLP